MAVAGIGMIGYGIWLLISGDGMGITLIIFGLIGETLSTSDLLALRAGGVKGKKRIAYHLSGMMAATIATLTAFLVTNFNSNPEFLLWLAPSVVISPIITWWSIRIQKGVKTKGMPTR